jgi:hypothetical protein
MQAVVEVLLDAGEARLRLGVANELKKLHIQVQVDQELARRKEVGCEARVTGVGEADFIAKVVKEEVPYICWYPFLSSL